MRISDWSSDVCSSDLTGVAREVMLGGAALPSALGLSLGWTVTFSGVGGRGDGGATPNTLSVESTTWGKGTFSPVISAYPTNATIAAERPADDSRVRVLGSATAITRMWAWRYPPASA